MALKVMGKIIFGFAAISSIYLMIAAVWASLSVGLLLPEVDSQPLLTTKQKEMLLKIEDPTFYSHIGVDVSTGQGLTTITSSLARNIFLSGENLHGVKGSFQSFYRSVFECCKKVDLGRDMMALILNRNLSKNQQLQLFVSTIYMGGHKGQQLKGFPGAATSYFNKPLSELSDDEFISLVARLKAPNYFHPTRGPNHLEDRVSKIKKILSGKCKPGGWFDTKYAHCAGNA